MNNKPGESHDFVELQSKSYFSPKHYCLLEKNIFMLMKFFTRSL